MNLKKMWPAAAVSLFALASLGHADDVQQAAKMADADTMRNMGQVIASSKGASKQAFSVSAEALYWDATQDHMSYGVIATQKFATLPTTQSSQVETAIFRTAKTDFDPGVRIGLGMFTTHDGFDVQLKWTHHEAKHGNTLKVTPEHNLFFVDAPNIIPLPSPTGTNLNKEGKSAWNLKTNLVDLELGRLFTATGSKFFDIRPHAGVRYVKIEQSRKLLLTVENTHNTTVTQQGVNSNQQVEFKGIGLRFGFDTQWGLGSGFYLFGNAAIAFAAGEFDVTLKESLNTPTADTMVLKHSEFSGKPIADMHYGLMYKRTASNDSLGMTFKLGWELHHFWGQNQMLRIDNVSNLQVTTTTATPPVSSSPTTPVLKLQKNGDLFLRGLTLSAHFDF